MAANNENKKFNEKNSKFIDKPTNKDAIWLIYLTMIV